MTKKRISKGRQARVRGGAKLKTVDEGRLTDLYRTQVDIIFADGNSSSSTIERSRTHSVITRNR